MMRVEWKWGALAALAMTIIALYPQVDLWSTRGKDWHGSYVLTQGDEVIYSAYVNALIDGRPRKNDPFSGRDVLPRQPAYESLCLDPIRTGLSHCVARQSIWSQRIDSFHLVARLCHDRLITRDFLVTCNSHGRQ